MLNGTIFWVLLHHKRVLFLRCLNFLDANRAIYFMFNCVCYMHAMIRHRYNLVGNRVVIKRALVRVRVRVR